MAAPLSWAGFPSTASSSIPGKTRDPQAGTCQAQGWDVGQVSGSQTAHPGMLTATVIPALELFIGAWADQSVLRRIPPPIRELQTPPSQVKTSLPFCRTLVGLNPAWPFRNCPDFLHPAPPSEGGPAGTRQLWWPHAQFLIQPCPSTAPALHLTLFLCRLTDSGL